MENLTFRQTNTHKGYEVHIVPKDIFGKVVTQGYVIIPEEDSLHGKIDHSLTSEHRIGASYLRNLLTMKFVWAIYFHLDGDKKDEALSACIDLIDQMEERC